mgnify:CR=1 FL=1
MRDMQRITTFSPLQKILSSFLNSFQDAAAPISAMNGKLVGGYLRSSGTTISVSPIKSLVIGNTYSSTSVATVLTPGSGGVPSLTTDTWYVVYAGISGGTIAFTVEEYVGNEPDLALVFKDGDPTLRYLGSFVSYTDSGTKIVPFLQHPGGLVRYNQRLDSHILLDTLTNATAPPHDVDNNVDLSTRAPAHTSTVVLRCMLSGPTDKFRVCFRNPGLTGYEGTEFKVELGTDETKRTFHVGPVEGDGTQVLEVRTTTDGATLDALEIYCDGYIEQDTRG